MQYISTFHFGTVRTNTLEKYSDFLYHVKKRKSCCNVTYQSRGCHLSTCQDIPGFPVPIIYQYRAKFPIQFPLNGLAHDSLQVLYFSLTTPTSCLMYKFCTQPSHLLYTLPYTRIYKTPYTHHIPVQGIVSYTISFKWTGAWQFTNHTLLLDHTHIMFNVQILYTAISPSVYISC